MQEVGKQNIHGRFSLANPIKFWIFFIFRNKIFVRVFCLFLPYGLNLLISNIKIYRSIIICRLLIRIRLSILYEMESGHKRTGFEPWLRFKKKGRKLRCMTPTDLNLMLAGSLRMLPSSRIRISQASAQWWRRYFNNLEMSGFQSIVCFLINPTQQYMFFKSIKIACFFLNR